jgi:hypothetical protein
MHPSRPAVDRCPACDRPRCGVDAQAAGSGCLACAGSAARRLTVHRPAGGPERLVRAALAAYAVALAGGIVASQYVGATGLSFLGPLVVGAVCGTAAMKAGRTEGRSDGAGALGTRIRAVAVLCAVLGVGVSLLLEGSRHPVSLRGDVLLPYAAAVAGALLGTVPPRARRAAQPRGTDV